MFIRFVVKNTEILPNKLQLKAVNYTLNPTSSVNYTIKPPTSVNKKTKFLKAFTDIGNVGQIFV